MVATRIFLLTLWTVFFVAAVCMLVELIRHATNERRTTVENEPAQRGPGFARHPLLAAGALALGISTLVLQSMAAP